MKEEVVRKGYIMEGDLASALVEQEGNWQVQNPQGSATTSFNGRARTRS